MQAAAWLLCPGSMPTLLPAHLLPFHCLPCAVLTTPLGRSRSPILGGFPKASSLALPVVVAWAGIWQGNRGAPWTGNTRASSPEQDLAQGPSGGSRQVWSCWRMPASRGSGGPSPTWNSGPCQASPCGVALDWFKVCMLSPTPAPGLIKSCQDGDTDAAAAAARSQPALWAPLPS